MHPKLTLCTVMCALQILSEVQEKVASVHCSFLRVVSNQQAMLQETPAYAMVQLQRTEALEELRKLKQANEQLKKENSELKLALANALGKTKS